MITVLVMDRTVAFLVQGGEPQVETFAGLGQLVERLDQVLPKGARFRLLWWSRSLVSSLHTLPPAHSRWTDKALREEVEGLTDAERGWAWVALDTGNTEAQGVRLWREEIAGLFPLQDLIEERTTLRLASVQPLVEWFLPEAGSRPRARATILQLGSASWWLATTKTGDVRVEALPSAHPTEWRVAVEQAGRRDGVFDVENQVMLGMLRCVGHSTLSTLVAPWATWGRLQIETWSEIGRKVEKRTHVMSLELLHRGEKPVRMSLRLAWVACLGALVLAGWGGLGWREQAVWATRERSLVSEQRELRSKDAKRLRLEDERKELQRCRNLSSAIPTLKASELFAGLGEATPAQLSINRLEWRADGAITIEARAWRTDGEVSEKEPTWVRGFGEGLQRALVRNEKKADWKWDARSHSVRWEWRPAAVVGLGGVR